MRAISEPEFFGDLVYKFKKLKLLFRKKNHYTIQTYRIYVMRQSACLAFNPIMVDNYDFKLFT